MVTYEYGYYVNWTSQVSSDLVFGIFALIFSVLGIICTTFLTYESIPFLLRRDNEPEAIVNLLQLRNESVMTAKLTDELDEMRLMVGQDKQDNENIFSNGNGSATGKLIALRILSTMTNNYLINNILISLTATLLGLNSFPMAPVILSGSRFAASFIPVVSTDFIKNKTHLTVSGATSGIVMLVLAIVLTTIDAYVESNIYKLMAALCIIFQISVSIGIDPMQHLLLSEAFSTSKKAWSIALVTSVEYLLQILFIGVYYVDIIDKTRLLAIAYVTAGVILASALLLHFAIPETFKKSLKETRDLFCK